MFPLLFEVPIFGGVRIYTYGLMYALGFLIGISYVARLAKKSDVSPETVLDLSFYIILAGVIGARVLYILTDWQRFSGHPIDVFKIWEGGLVFYGGLIGAMIASYVYTKKHKISFLKVLDLFMPGASLGHAIGRLGCLAAGCCYGKPAPAWFPFSISFPASSHSLAPVGVPLYPTQIIESLSLFLVFLFLARLYPRRKFDGQVFISYVISYGIIRILVEIFRGDLIRGFLIPNWLSTSQFISIGFIIFAVILYRVLKQRSLKS